VPPTVTERGAAIFVSTLIQRTNGFKRAPSSGEIAKLILIYTIVPKEDDLQEPEKTPKFIKASNWITNKTPELTNKLSTSKTPNSGTSSWNTLNILENTSRINAIELHEEKDNPWKSLTTGRLISPLGTLSMESQISQVGF